MGILPLHIETGRYNSTPLLERICPLCKEEVETELHFIFKCSHYNEYRENYNEMFRIVNRNDDDQLLTQFKILCSTSPRKLAKFISDIYVKRHDLLYK